jgi:DNA-binding SARP family transcriptional activator
MAQDLQVNFFGEFRLNVRAEPSVEWVTVQLPPTAKSQSLLAYLILYRNKTHSREQLAEQFWQDRPPRRARRSLSTSLWHIHRGFTDSNPIESDNQSIQFRFPGETKLDVEQFEAAIAQGSSSENLEKSISIYQGDFLDGYYDDWVISQRYRYQSQYIDASTQLMRYYQEQNDNHQVLDIALKLLKLDPLQENVHRAVMQAYTALGQRSAALKQFEQCQQILSSDLNITPTSETILLHEQILSGELDKAKAQRIDISTTPTISNLGMNKNIRFFDYSINLIYFFHLFFYFFIFSQQ